MSEAIKPTPGRAFCKRDGFSTVYVDVRIGGGMLQEVAACGPTANGPDEQQANAELIAEAFNVHNVTGMTPSQLLDCLNESQMDAARYRWLLIPAVLAVLVFSGCTSDVDTYAAVQADLADAIHQAAKGGIHE